MFSVVYRFGLVQGAHVEFAVETLVVPPPHPFEGHEFDSLAEPGVDADVTTLEGKAVVNIMTVITQLSATTTRGVTQRGLEQARAVRMRRRSSDSDDTDA